MYSDKRSNKRPLVLIAILLIIISLMVLFLVFKDSGRDLSDESAMAIRDAVRKEALQCYVVEGVYPPDLDYLENNYGLKTFGNLQSAVTSGVGFYGPPLRVGCDSEIMVLDIQFVG